MISPLIHLTHSNVEIKVPSQWIMFVTSEASPTFLWMKRVVGRFRLNRTIALHDMCCFNSIYQINDVCFCVVNEWIIHDSQLREREISSHAANHQLHIITEPVSKTRQFHMILYNYAAFINYTRGLDNSNPTYFFPFCSSFSFSMLFTFLLAPILSIYLSRTLHDSPRPEKTKTILGSGFKKIKSEGENCMKRQRIDAKQKNMNEIVLSSNLEKISLLQLSTSCCRLLCEESEWERTTTYDSAYRDAVSTFCGWCDTPIWFCGMFNVYFGSVYWIKCDEMRARGDFDSKKWWLELDTGGEENWETRMSR